MTWTTQITSKNWLNSSFLGKFVKRARFNFQTTREYLINNSIDFDFTFAKISKLTYSPLNCDRQHHQKVQLPQLKVSCFFVRKETDSINNTMKLLTLFRIFTLKSRRMLLSVYFKMIDYGYRQSVFESLNHIMHKVITMFKLKWPFCKDQNVAHRNQQHYFSSTEWSGDDALHLFKKFSWFFNSFSSLPFSVQRCLRKYEFKHFHWFSYFYSNFADWILLRSISQIPFFSR